MWCDYEELPHRLQMQAHLLRPRWERKEFRRFAFWVRPDGNLSKRSGHHQLTEEETRRMNKQLALLFTDGAKPEKGGIRHLRTAKFSLNKEPL